MAFPLQHLPVLQNWDCHTHGTCCKEYRVGLSDEECRRIIDQGWDPKQDLAGLQPIVTRGPFWNRTRQLEHQPDGSCVFLSDQGRCRIHERFGYEAKPLACRLFPFVLVPVGDHWRVSVRFACPSAAQNKGRAIPERQAELADFAAELARREGLATLPDGTLNLPPRLQTGQQVSWPDVLRITATLTDILANPRDPVERRLRKCLTLAGHLRAARLGKIEGARLGELLGLLRSAADAETPADPTGVPAPGWVGRILFRQAASLFTRKDHGPNRGLAASGRGALLKAALRFARGTGPVPRMHRGLPAATFEEAEVPLGPLPAQAEEVLGRYYLTKVGSLQFCGSASFGLPFWEGFEMLALTYPVLLWVVRILRDRPRDQAVMTALTIVDDHIGFNRVLGTLRQRLGVRILARGGELSRLIAWYSR
jgi:lysine-N-methylase